MPTAPLIVNLLPLPGQSDFDLTGPVRITVRDPETHVDAGLLRVSAGYAQVFGAGDIVFDKDPNMPGTFFSTVLDGFVAADKVDTLLVAEGVQITKTIAGVQRSVVFTPIEAEVGFPDAMVTAVVRPDIITVSALGAVLGMEHGPRNIGAYLFFEDTGGGAQLRLTGPADEAGTRVPDRVVAHDWSAIQRYIIIWNEVLGVMELYSVSAAGVTSLVTTEPIANFQQFDSGGVATPRQGGASAITAVYGIEGALGDRVTIGNVSVTRDVAYPIIGIARPGQFETVRRTDESIRYKEGDPRDQEVSPWFGPPSNSVFPNPDPAGAMVLLDEGVRISKLTPTTTFGIQREEPGIQESDTDGYILEAEFFGTPTTVLGTRITGMGFVINDGQTSMFLSLIAGGASRTLGILLNGGDVTTIGDFLRPLIPVDWSSPVRFRFTVDPRRNKVEMFLSSDIVTPILSVDFTRGDFATPADMGLAGEPPLIAFGHINEIATTGSFELRELTYSHTYQAWEARDGVLPDVVPTDPLWQSITTGFLEVSPLSGLHLLGGGFGPTPLGYFVLSGSGPAASPVITADNQLQIVADPGETMTYYRSATFGTERGAIIETSLQITSHKPKARSGCFLVLDDGLHSYMLSFVDTDVGKFAAVPVRAGLNSFIEEAGTDGDAEKLSFKIDWSEPHTYRMERRPLDGLYIFVDNDPEPSLVIPDTDRVDYPGSQFCCPTVAFGVLSSEGSTSLWDYTRTMFGSGYEISFKVKTDTAGLEEKIRNSQAVVVASADDV